MIQVDIKLDGQDVRLIERDAIPRHVHGILAAPPCTHLAASGARWWQQKGKEALLEALSITDACLRLVALLRPRWWALENPVGRLTRYYGPPQMYFHPYEYAALSDESEAYTKKTGLWGDFTPPTPLLLGQDTSLNPVRGSLIYKMPDSKGRKERRSITPLGFARAFYRANP